MEMARVGDLVIVSNRKWPDEELRSDAYDSTAIVQLDFQ